MDDGSNSWEAWALGPSSRAPPAGHRTIGIHDPSIPARKKAPAHHTRPGVGTHSSWPRQPTGGDGLSRHDGSPVDKTWFSCRYGAPRATLRRNPPSRRPPSAVFRNRWERAAEAGGSGNSERARTEINCFSKRHLETPQPRLVFQQEEACCCGDWRRTMQDNPETSSATTESQSPLQSEKRKGRRTLSPLPSSSCSKLCRN